MALKSKSIPILFTLITIIIVVYLIANIKQTEIVCEKTQFLDKEVLLYENVVAQIDRNKIGRLLVTKTIKLPSQYADAVHISRMRESLDKTLSYLEDDVQYTITNSKIVVTIDVSKNEIVLLDNIRFLVEDDFNMIVDSNTKSESVIPLTIGDSYTDSEFLKFMKDKGYSCK